MQEIGESFAGEGGNPFEKGLSSFPRTPILFPKTFNTAPPEWTDEQNSSCRGAEKVCGRDSLEIPARLKENKKRPC